MRISSYPQNTWGQDEWNIFTGQGWNAGNIGDTVLLQRVASTPGDLAGGTSSYFGFDASGNIRLIFDGSGNVTDRMTYEAFGELFGRTGSTATPFLFGGSVGYYQDALRRMNVGWRVYDPIVGKWMSVDPIGFDGDDWNLYRYVENNPVNAVDPSGLAKVEVHFRPTGVGNTLHAYIQVWETGGKSSYVVHAFPSQGSGLTNSIGSIPSAASEVLRKKYYLPVPQISSPCGTVRGFIHAWGSSLNFDKGFKVEPLKYVVASDPSKSARFYLNKLYPTLVKLNAANIPYNPLTTNSNSFVAEILESSGLDIFARVRIKQVGRIPGWETALS